MAKEEWKKYYEGAPSTKRYLVIAIVAIALVFGFAFIGIPRAECGNNICEKGEDCFSCFKDCPCPEGQYCSLELKLCVSPTCGNNECEYFEKDCCIDCGCTGGEVCNIALNKCEEKEFTISDERIQELVTEYFAGQGKEVESIEIGDLTTWENKVGKNVMVFIKDQDWFSSVIVTEDEEVVDVTL